VIGNFLYALGLKAGALQNDYLAPDLAVSLLQQTPLDIVLGDVLLAGPRSVALLEFKRAADRRNKERDKLLQIEALLQRPQFRALRDTSRRIHFYVETGDVLEDGFSRVLPYLDLRTGDRRRRLEHLIDDLACRARSAPELAEMDRNDCQRYLELVCICQGRSYHPSPGLLVGVGGDGRVAFAPVDDIRDLRTTFAAIREHEITLAQAVNLALTREFRLRRAQSRTPRQSVER
jgi:hypothetical protein